MPSTLNFTLEDLVAPNPFPVPATLFTSTSLWQNILLLICVGLVFLASVSLLSTTNRGDGLPVANRLFAFEPQLFARLRWACFAKRILNNAHRKFGGKPYLLARGDMDVIVLPAELIPELNRLPADVINTREFHSHTLLGHLTGVDIVRKTDFHVKILLSRISPAIPKFLQPVTQRMYNAVDSRVSQNPKEWKVINPLDFSVQCVSTGVSYLLYGQPTCDNPDMIRLCYKHTADIFTIVFLLRCVPAFLQPVLVWLLPAKWRLTRSWATLHRTVQPELERRKNESQQGTDPNVISWMMQDGKTELERDPVALGQLVGALTAGGTYSTAGLVAGVMADVTSHPKLLAEIRDEIRAKHEEINGNWDKASLNSLPKLDSVMKETSRLAPSSVVIYSRHMLEDYTLSTGLKLSKGQRITVVPHLQFMNPEVFENPADFDGLRHMSGEPFRRVDTTLLTWGAGRWACPGRFLANTMAKSLLIKLFDEYEFKLIEGKPPKKLSAHEFVLFSPFNQLMVRRRETSLGINFPRQTMEPVSY